MSTSETRPTPPKELDPEALREWNRVCDELQESGRLDKTDRAILTVYVETWSVHRAATQGVIKHGAVIRYPNKTTGPSPFYKVQKETAVLLEKQLAALGFTPAARNRMKAPTEQPAEELEF